MTADVVGRIWSLAEPVVVSLGLELIEVDLAGGGRRQVLRLYIDRPGGVTLEDCRQVSRELGALLDAEDPIGPPYHLEVSSPGLERPLRRPGDFRRFAGRRARIRLRDPQGRPRVVSGAILGIEGEVVALETAEGETERFSLGEIAKARLEVDWESEFRRADRPADAEPGEVRKGGHGK